MDQMGEPVAERDADRAGDERYPPDQLTYLQFSLGLRRGKPDGTERKVC